MKRVLYCVSGLSVLAALLWLLMQYGLPVFVTALICSFLSFWGGVEAAEAQEYPLE